MASKNDFSKVISKLNRLTQEGVVTWRRTDPPKSIMTGTDDHIFNFYLAKYKGKYIGLYEERYQNYSMDLDNYYWAKRTVLALFSPSLEKEWEFPVLAGTEELKESVQYQVADVDVFVSDFLDGDEKKT